jgi:putative transposase
VTVLCRVMLVSRSSYYQHLKQQQPPNCLQKCKLETLVKSIHKASKESYGSRRISEALQGHGYPIGRYQARSLMRKLNLVAKPSKKPRPEDGALNVAPGGGGTGYPQRG